MSHPLILFIVKKFHGSGGPGYKSSGLGTSSLFAVELLLKEGHKARLVSAVDGNCIDRLVSENRPTRVVLEAVWVTPSKLQELMRLHPRVKWTIRVHSEIPFLANEGTVVGWLVEYLKLGAEIAFNSAQTVADFSVLGKSAYLPNYYPLRKLRHHKKPSDHLNIGCFGAVRPLKNQLIQAFAAVQYARERGKGLFFHMNGSRIEQNGDNNLKQIQALLEATNQKLVLHPWLDHEDFLDLVADMDMCLQVSLSESFNITSADAISMGVPLVGSSAINWLPKRTQAQPNSVQSIVNVMNQADYTSVVLNHASLEHYVENTTRVWNDWAS